ncbi:MAG: hypothetical protein AAF512_03610 [Pseudomonadota bacterium]
MKHALLFLIFSLLANPALAGDNYDLPPPLNAPVAPFYEGSNGIYNKIFLPVCAICHDSRLSRGDRNGAPLDINFDTYEQALASAARGVVRAVEGSMPPAPQGSMDQLRRDAMLAWEVNGFLQTDPGIPAVNAGPVQHVREGEEITLFGSAIDLEDGVELNFCWFQKAGPTVELASNEQPQLTFTAPTIRGDYEVLAFELSVVDSDMKLGKSAVHVLVTKVDVDLSISGRFSPVTNILELPAVNVDGEDYFSGRLSMTDAASLTFVLTDAGLLTTRPPAAGNAIYSSAINALFIPMMVLTDTGDESPRFLIEMLPLADTTAALKFRVSSILAR